MWAKTNFRPLPIYGFIFLDRDASSWLETGRLHIACFRLSVHFSHDRSPSFAFRSSTTTERLNMRASICLYMLRTTSVISFLLPFQIGFWVLAAFCWFRFRLVMKCVFLTASQNGLDLTDQSGAKLARNSCNFATHDRPRFIRQNNSVT